MMKDKVITELLSRIAKLEYEVEEKNSIINKAIEYIENNSYFEGNAVKTMIYQDYSKGIVEILLGSDKE